MTKGGLANGSQTKINKNNYILKTTCCAGYPGGKLESSDRAELQISLECIRQYEQVEEEETGFPSDYFCREP